MMPRTFLARLAALFPAYSRDSSELLRERGIMLSRMIPLLYAILIANAWGLAVTFLHRAPLWLTAYAPTVLTLFCGVRGIWWLGRRGRPLEPAAVLHQLRQMDRLGFVLAISVCIWTFALFPYADTFGRGHIAFFIVITLLGTIFCLSSALSTAIVTASIVGPIGACFLIASGNEDMQAMGATLFAVTVAAMVVVVTQSRTFARMVNASAEARQKHEEQGRLLRMIDDMPVAAMTIAPDTFLITYANQAAQILMEQVSDSIPIEPGNLIGTCIDVFHQHPERQRRMLADPGNLPFQSRVMLGKEIVDLKISAVTTNDGSYIGLMQTLAIVTKEVEAERHIWHLARYDSLTQLPNRTTFHEEIREYLEKSDDGVCLLYIDLDGFKTVNDTRGHRTGDKLLVQVANRLRKLCDEPDIRLARLGGDEFAVFLARDESFDVHALANQIIAGLSAPYDLDPGKVRIGASVGIAFSPDHGRTAEALLTRADIALYAAKAIGKGVAQTFTPDMEKRIQERVLLESRLREALQSKQGLSVFYQPIIAIDTGTVTAREALVRWQHPSRGWISPAEFVPVAEQSGLIDALGEFVLNTACRDAAGWEDGARVAVNISANQLGKDSLAQNILAALISSGLKPDRLEIEITETALLNEALDVIGDLRRVRALGVRVALDDFGTGFSSLAHLRLFPFDKIKIDGSFVQEAANRPDCAAIVHAVADLGRRLGVTTVAEGVETQAQLDCIRAEGCTEVQGYLVGRPSPNSMEEESAAPNSAAG